MAHLLRLDSSARGANSQSRALGDDFETTWLATPGRTVKRLDLAAAARAISRTTRSTDFMRKP